MDAVIFDVDGTLCDVRPVRHYLDSGKRNFHRFHSSSLFCRPNWGVLQANMLLPRTLAAIVVTARENRYHRVTHDWLHKWNIRHERLYMRNWGDYRPDYEVKSEILEQIRNDGFNPVHAFDDNPDVVRLWREHGIPTTVVPGF